MTAPRTRSLRFEAVIRVLGINPYVKVSAARARLIRSGWRRPMPVLIRIDGHPRPAPWRINLMPIGDGAFYLYLHGDVRRASKRGVGDRVVVDISFDVSYRNGPMRRMPMGLAKGLRADPRARAGWKGLTPSRQKEILRYLANLKTPAARARNLAGALSALSGQTRRFMARDW